MANVSIKTGDHIKAEWWPESVEDDDSTSITNITSTSYIAGSPACEVTFTTPPSGRIGVAVAAGMTEQSAGDRVLVSFEVYEGTSASGTLKQSARDSRGVTTNGDTGAGGETVLGNMTMVDGLTPLVTHYARIVYKVDAGTTNDISRRRIIVIPMP